MQGFGLSGAWPWVFSGLVLKVPSAGGARPGHGSNYPVGKADLLSDHGGGCRLDFASALIAFSTSLSQLLSFLPRYFIGLLPMV